MRFIQPVSLFTNNNPNINNNHSGDNANGDPIYAGSSLNDNQFPAWNSTTATSDASQHNNLNRSFRQPYSQLGHHRQTEEAKETGERVNIVNIDTVTADEADVSVRITSANAVSFTKHSTSQSATSIDVANVIDSKTSRSVHPENTQPIRRSGLREVAQTLLSSTSLTNENGNENGNGLDDISRHANSQEVRVD